MYILNNTYKLTYILEYLPPPRSFHWPLWFPYFANSRRDGYDFDATWDDELVQRHYKAIMSVFEDAGEVCIRALNLNLRRDLAKTAIRISMVAPRNYR